MIRPLRRPLSVLVLAGCASAVAQAECRLARVAEWPVRMDGRYIVVDGEVSGRKVGVMLDTGAMRTVMMRVSAVRLGLPRQPAPGVRMVGIGGETQVESTTVPELRIGDAARKNWSMLVAGEQDPVGAFDIVLGEDFLSKFDVEFDVPHAAIRLFEPTGCEKTSLSYWSRDASAIDIERVSDVKPEVVLEVEVNGKRVPATLDSGAAATTIDLRFAKEVGVTPASPGSSPAGKWGGIGSRKESTWVGTFASFVVGGERIRDARIFFLDFEHDSTYSTIGSRLGRPVQARNPVLLGADFLRSHRVLVAHSQSAMYFSYAGGTVFGPAALAR